MSTTQPSPMTPDAAAAALLDPRTFSDPALAFACGDVLREESPFHHIEHPEYEPLTIVSRFDDVYEIEIHDAEFVNGTDPVLAKRHRIQARAEAGQEFRTLITMDEPEHGSHRALLQPWFSPRVLRALQPRIEELARQAVDRMMALGGECDFATEVAIPLPLQVILSTIGLPDSDYDQMLRLTQQLFSPDDPDVGRGDSTEEITAVLAGFFDYFSDLVADRTTNPCDDLATTIATGQIDGCPITQFEKFGHYTVLATAGHDTTSSALAGGLEALLAHPEQLERLRAHPELISNAADEIIRWVTPVKHFMRQVAEPYEISGHRFEPGDRVYMSYVAANRDPRAIEDPYRFDVGRTGSRHLAFGFGVHYCLGANLARMEVRAVLAELLPRLRHIELAGPVEWAHSTVVSGPKHIPVRYELTPALQV